MILKLTRRYNEKNTIGVLIDESGNELCKIGEPPLYVMINGKKHHNVPDRCCIPEGTYTVRKHRSLKFGKCFAFSDKETFPRGNILIHAGNFFGDYKMSKTDSHGCLICGFGFLDINNDKIIDVVNSKAALAQLLKVLPDEFKIEIRGEE